MGFGGAVFVCAKRLAGSLFPDEGLYPGSQQRKLGVLIPGLPGNSLNGSKGC